MFRTLPLALLAACAPTLSDLPDATGSLPEGPVEPEGDAYVSPVEVEELVGNLTLTVGEVHPGGTVRLTIGNADPGETVHIASSLGGVSVGPCPAALGGLCLNLGTQTVYSGSVIADVNGTTYTDLSVPDTLPQGARVAFQLAAVRGAGGASSVKSSAVVKTVGAPTYRNTVAVDGSLGDWTADELFPTTSQGQGGVTWDASMVYVAFDHPDVSTGGAQHWQVATFATGRPGSTVGPTIGTQAPGLPFEAEVVVRRKADGSYDDVLVWNPVTQAYDAYADLVGLGFSVAESGTQLEIGIPRIWLLSTSLGVVLSNVYEGAGFESTYAGVPSTAFVDGYDPNVTDALVVDLNSPDPAGVQNP